MTTADTARRLRTTRRVGLGAIAVATALPASLLVGMPALALVVLEQIALTVGGGAFVLWFVASTLPPVAAAWFLGFRDGVEPERGDPDGGRRLRAV